MSEVHIPPKKVHVETWGCQMNVADSERMLTLLAEKNYHLTDKAEDADLILLNTCHIREKANHKVLSRLGVLKELKANRPAMKIAVAGCVAQAEGKKLLKRAPQIDVLLGPGKIEDINRLIEESENGGQAMGVGFEKNREGLYKKELPPLPYTLSGKNEVSRFVNIQHGCNNFCTFCVVPFTRGQEICRTPTEIIDECQAMVAGGAREITLLGQNVNSYGQDLLKKEMKFSPSGPFVDLLTEVTKIEGLERLRFTTSNPHDFTKPLADLFSKEAKLGRYIHLPVQSGNNDVLKAMRRKVTIEEFHARVAWLRTIIPDMAISTDLIVGFPGETEEQFEDTLKLLQQARFSFVFAFQYSSRKGTAAARFKNQVPDEVKAGRLARLNELQNQITIEQNHAEVGQDREVLVLYQSKKQADIYYGRTQHFRLVRIESPIDLTGQLIDVTVTDANKTALVGKPV